LIVSVLVGIDAVLVPGFGSEVEGNCALWLGCVIDFWEAEDESGGIA
jgi:hypothetical protein